MALTEVVGAEGGVPQLVADLLHVFIGAADEENRLEVHQFLGWHIIDRVNEEDLFLKDLSPRVDHGDDH